mgnify:CR=1 FL=1
MFLSKKKRNGFHILAMRKKHLYIMKQRETLTFLIKKALSSIDYKQINRLWDCSTYKENWREKNQYDEKVIHRSAGET